MKIANIGSPAGMKRSKYWLMPPAGTRFNVGALIKSSLLFVFGGNIHRKLIEQLKVHFGVKHAMLFNSGRAALTITLRALALRDSRTDVIVPGYTCFSVPSAIKLAGLKVVPVEIEPDTMEYEMASLERAITSSTLAILLIYPFNLTAHFQRVFDLARKHKVYLVEDAAQAMGLQIDGALAGTAGDVGIYSLSKGKPITSVRGGIVVTNNTQIGQSIKSLSKTLSRASLFESLKIVIESRVMWIFLRPLLFWIIGRLPFVTLGETVYAPSFAISRMARASVSLCLAMLPKLHAINSRRARKAHYYIQQLAEIRGITIIAGFNPAKSLFLRLPILVSDVKIRDELYERLKHLGVSRMYREPLSIIEDTELFGDCTGQTPAAADVASRLLTLPTHDFVRQNDQDEIVASLRSYFERDSL